MAVQYYMVMDRRLHMGLRPSDPLVTDLGALADDDSIPIDRALVNAAKKTTPAGIKNYLVAEDTFAPTVHDHDGQTIKPDVVEFSTPLVVPTTEGSMSWNAASGTVDLVMGGGLVTQQIGEEQFFHVKALGNIVNGQVVIAVGTIGNSAQIIASAAPILVWSGTAFNYEPRYVLGVATEAITNGNFGFITSFGLVRGLNITTMGAADDTANGTTGGWPDGTVLYVDPTRVGSLTKTVPIAPLYNIIVAMVIHNHANGSMFIRVNNGLNLRECHDVDTEAVTASQFLQRDVTNRYWGAKTLVTTDLTDLDIGTDEVLAANQVLKYNGSYWVNTAYLSLKGLTITEREGLIIKGSTSDDYYSIYIDAEGNIGSNKI